MVAVTPLGVSAVIRILGVALVGVALLGLPAAAQTGSNIIAGQSAGSLRIGTSVSDVIAALGSLYESEDSESGKYTLYDWPLKPFAVAVDKESNRVVLVLVGFTDAFSTDKGIAGGSERQAVETAYGKEYTASEGSRSTRIIYDDLGIAFDLGRSGALSSKVTQIFIFVPGQWKAIMEGL